MLEGSTLAIIKRLGVPNPLSAANMDDGLEGLDGGMVNFLVTTSALVKKVHRLMVFTTNPDGETKVEQSGRMEVHRIGLRRHLELEGMQRDLLEGIEFSSQLLRYPPFLSCKFDFIHSHHWSSAVEPLISKVRPRRAHIHTPHFLAAEKMRALGLPILSGAIEAERWLVSNADSVIALSQCERQAVMRQYGVPEERIFVIPNGVSTIFTERPLMRSEVLGALKESPTRVASIGRIAPQKGYEVLFRAMGILRGRGRAVHCSIIGGGYFEPRYERMLKMLIAELALENSISFVGPLDRNGVVRHLRKSAVYVQSSHYESQGVALIESMALGLPVIATRSPAVVEAVRDEENGLLVDLGNHEALAGAISRVIIEPELGARMSGRGIQTGAEYSWRTTSELTLRCFLLSSRPDRES